MLRLPLLAAVAGLLVAGVARAEDPVEPTAPAAAPDLTAEAGDGDAADHDLEDVAPRHRFDPSRCSDGPRRVPVPRGASKLRAEALGLGTREAASTLLHQPVPAAWASAARGRPTGRILWPVDEGRWVRGFGYVRTTDPDRIHRGVDIAAPVGTPIRAAADGIVAYSDNGVRGYGNLVLIVHANGWMTLYGHASRTTVQPGYRVRRGERIGLVGQTGIARGPHLHFELWQAGRAVDPAAYFDGGPRYVQRLAERAAARGLVPPPRPLTAQDRIVEPPLPPDAPSARAARSTAPAAPPEPARAQRGRSSTPRSAPSGSTPLATIAPRSSMSRASRSVRVVGPIRASSRTSDGPPS